MLSRFRTRLTFANVTSLVALFVALGGSGYAAVTINGGQLKNRSVAAKKLKKNTLSGTEINESKLGKVPSAGFAANARDLGGKPASAYLKGRVGPAQFGTLPAVRVTNSTFESIASSSNTVLTFDTNEYDNDGMHSTTTNTSRLTAPVSGIYEVVGDVAWAENATGGRTLAILKNGSTNVGDSSVSVNNGAYGTEEEVTTQVRLSAGDYVVLSGFQNSGGPLRANQNPDYSPVFAMHWVAP